MAEEAKIALYLNEHFSDDIAVALRERGYDVVSSHGSEMDGKPDADQLVYAVSQKRALLTGNFGDFIDSASTKSFSMSARIIGVVTRSGYRFSK